MIVWNEKIKKSDDVIKAVINELYKIQVNIDGVVEHFNNGKEQGSVLKLYDKYNPIMDICLWIYLPNNRPVNNHMEVIVGKHINCNDMNVWGGSDLEVYSFEDTKSREMHNMTRDFVIETITKNLEKTHDVPRL